MKLKIRLGSGGIKGLFSQHVEKMVLAAVLLLACLMIFFGFSHKPVEANKGPDELQIIADKASRNVDRTTWSALEQERFSEPDRYDERVDEALIEVKYTPYSTLTPLSKPLFPSRIKRDDPELYAIIETMLVSGGGAMAEPRDLDSLEDLEDDEGERRNDLLDFEDGMLGGPIFKEIPNELPGYQPQGANAVAKGYHWVSIMALVPTQKQLEEFDRCFANSLGFDELRDTPRYVFFSVQRAEILSDGTQDDWQTIGDLREMNRLMDNEWSVGPEEIADPRYVHEALTMPPPPIMLRDLEKWLLHSKVPRQPLDSFQDDLLGRRKGTNRERGNFSDDPTEYLESEQNQEDEGMGIGRSRRSVGRGGGVGMEDFSSGRRSRRPPRGAAGGRPRARMGGGRRRMGGGGGGLDDNNEMGMMGGGGGRGRRSSPGGRRSQGMGLMRAGVGSYLNEPVEYTLFRYFDTTVLPGKTYKYRVRLFLEDPNHPQEEYYDPLDRLLAPKVRQRLAKEGTKEDGTRRWIRFTDWSEPGSSVTVTSGHRVLAGTVKPAAVRPIGEGNVPVQVTEPSITVMAIVWDPAKAMDVPAEKNMFLGSVVNFRSSGEVYVMNPISRAIETIEDNNYYFQTNAMVLDIRGGQRMPGRKRRSEPAPGELLLIDSEGTLVVHDELADYDIYQRHQFLAKEPKSGRRINDLDEEFGGGMGLEDFGGKKSSKSRRKRGSSRKKLRSKNKGNSYRRALDLD